MKTLVANLLKGIAENTSSAATWLIGYQPEEPKTLKKDK